MAKQIYANNFTTTLASDITDSATTLTLTTATGAPTITAESGDWFVMHLIDADGDYEIVKVTARTTVTCTIERAQEGTTAAAHTASPVTVCQVALTSGTLDRFETAIADLDTLEDDVDDVIDGTTSFTTTKVIAHRSVQNQLIPAITETRIQFNAVTKDSLGELNITTTPGIFTATIDGDYLINVGAMFISGIADGTALTMSIGVSNGEDGSTIAKFSQTANGTVHSLGGSKVASLSAGDIVNVNVYSTVQCYLAESSGSETYTFLDIVRIP